MDENANSGIAGKGSPRRGSPVRSTDGGEPRDHDIAVSAQDHFVGVEAPGNNITIDVTCSVMHRYSYFTGPVCWGGSA